MKEEEECRERSLSESSGGECSSDLNLAIPSSDYFFGWTLFCFCPLKGGKKEKGESRTGVNWEGRVRLFIPSRCLL